MNPAADLESTATDENGFATVLGSGFGAGETVSIMIASDAGTTAVDSAEANEGGAFVATIEVDMEDGIYSLWAIGDQGTEASTPLQVGEIK